MASRLCSILAAAAFAFRALGQADMLANPLRMRSPSVRPLRQALLGALPARCPLDHPDAKEPLPLPLPPTLATALAGLEDLLGDTVDASFPALSGKPQAAALRMDYRGERLTTAFVGDTDPKVGAGLPDEHTIFRIGSVSKIFSVLMAYQLFDRGVVSSLDDPLSKYAPGFEYANVYSLADRQCTLRQLASQLSGMQRELPCPMFDCHLTTQEIIERMKESPGAQFAEYTEPSYSNAAYSLLGNVLADFVNVPYAEYVERNILMPLGMADTGFVFTEAVERHMAKPYVYETLVPNVDIGYNAPAGQMYSTINDLMKLSRYYLGLSGKLFDDGLRRELLMPSFIWRDGSFLQGSPWEVQLLSGDWLMLGKGGNVPGFSAAFAMIPNLNLSLAVLWSGPFDETTFMANVFEQILPALVPALRAQRAAPAMPKTAGNYIGSYILNSTTITIYQRHVEGVPFLEAFALGVFQLPVALSFFDEQKATVTVYGRRGADYPGNCFLDMAMGEENLWITFNLESGGKAVSLEMPGFLYGAKFERAKEVSTAPEMFVFA